MQTAAAASGAGTAGEAGSDEAPAPPPTLSAALATFFRVLGDTLSLLLRLVLVEPLSWVLDRMGLQALVVQRELAKLERAAAEGPLDPARLAAVLRAFNKHGHHTAVVDVSCGWLGGWRCAARLRSAYCSWMVVHGSIPTCAGFQAQQPGPHVQLIVALISPCRCRCPHPLQLVEARCLGRGGAPAAALSAGTTGGRFAVNAAVVREYLTALVVTGRLAQFGDDPSAAPDQGQSHRSLRQLLAELQALSAGRQVADAPGSTVAHPLHVIVQSQVRTAAGAAAAAAILG